MWNDSFGFFWGYDKKRWIFVKSNEFHSVVFRSLKSPSDKFYQSQQRLPGYEFKSWCLPLDKEHGLD